MSDTLLKIQETDLPLFAQPSNHTSAQIDSGLTWPRLFGEGDPYAAISWEIRTAKITRGNGEVVFEQKNVEVPDFWSQTATDIVASKYFRGRMDAPDREFSARQMVDRVANAIAEWGFKGGYFKTIQDCENFRHDLKFLLINQFAAFNSPVWFNVGVHERPQCSACFILSVEDTMQSILEWYRDEGIIFKGGSGSGLNVSQLRSSKESLSKGGYSSGPVSFMKGADGVANSIKSGGQTRRAAKMVVMNADHPDIKDFIYCKKHIEDYTRVLEASGIKATVDGDLFNPYTLLPYQNANNSVRVTDDFMQRVENDGAWDLKAITTGQTMETHKAREVMDWVADAAWHSADPGMQFDTIINQWHTCPNTGRINASNPCSEYMHIDNSACNLASINLLKFLQADGTFDTEYYKKTIDTIITAQEIIVGNSSYPTEKITRNAFDYRQLGLGYANLGSLLMSLGLPYDSEGGRHLAGALTSILSGEGYLMSAKIAALIGPFNGFEKNREPMLNVIRMHRSAAQTLADQIQPPLNNGYKNGNGHSNGFTHPTDWRVELAQQAVAVWDEALVWGEKFGYRNSQATVLAPTGTIAFLMDCQTTGVEPELALVKYKKLVGGGLLKLVNTQAAIALQRLGYDESQIKDISDYILAEETIEGAPHLKTEHLPVFDCSFKAQKGTRSIHYMGHVKMMGAVQPFISGAISKTVNLPKDATVADIRDAFIQAWKYGLKAIAVYRDESKSVQPLNTQAEAKTGERSQGYTRVKLPEERESITHRFSLGNHKGYLTIGLYPDTKKPGETFITIAKEGSTLSGLFDVIATLTSICLQSGVPLKTLVEMFKDSRFEPSGMTSNTQIPFAKSFIDYIFRYLGYKFLSPEEQEEVFGQAYQQDALPMTAIETAPASAPVATTAAWDTKQKRSNTDAPLCDKCGAMMYRTGTCYTCPNCFATSGVCQ